MKQKWVIKDKINKEDLNKFPEINPVILQLLYDRGLKTQAEIDEFLLPDYSQDIHDPFLFSDMQKVVKRINRAKENNEKIVIYGDYDADGVCGTSILARLFKELDIQFDVYLPHRELEGYGLNEKAIIEIAKAKAKLIITVDCGISNVKEVDLANSLGLEVIITDHHGLPEVVPKAFGIIHSGLDTKYPFKYLAGGGVAFKLAQAFLKGTKYEILEKWLLDLVAISTVADMVPLIGENRTLVKYGLIVLSKTKNLGLQKLIEITGINIDKIDTFTIGYQIAPRINAAGRMAHANNAYQLLTTDNIEEAITIAHSLNKSNTERQSLTDKIVMEVLEQIGSVKKESVLYAKGSDWPAGLIGLVASKIVRQYFRPVLIFSEVDNLLVASARSIEEFNLIEALNELKDYFVKYGGHKGAAGFSMEPNKYEDFKKEFTKLVKKKLKDIELLPRIDIDLEIKLNEINWPIIELLLSFEPYGQGNLRPKFRINDLKIVNLETVGNDQKHLRLILSDGELERKVIAFGFGECNQELELGQKIDIICEISINQWNGNKEIQLSLIDFKV